MAKTAANAEVQLELDAIPQGINQLTDSGDRLNFTSTTSPWSRLDAHAAVVRPNGLATGGAITPAVSTTDNLVDTAALTGWLAGVLTSVGADTDIAASRGVTNGFRITSITVTSAGAIAAVAGTESTAFTETRAAAGGPPLIPVGSFEIGQVRLTSTSAAAVTAAEIFTVAGLHRELAGSPTWTVDYANGEVDFRSALPAIHTGAVGKAVYATYSQPVFSEVVDAADFVPAVESFTANSSQRYKRVVNSVSRGLTVASFNALLEDGVSDPVLGLIGQRVWCKFFPDSVASTDHNLSNGVLGITPAFPAGDNINGAFTITTEEKGANIVT